MHKNTLNQTHPAFTHMHCTQTHTPNSLKETATPSIVATSNSYVKKKGFCGGGGRKFLNEMCLVFLFENTMMYDRRAVHMS